MLSLEADIEIAIRSFAFAELVLLSAVLAKSHFDNVIARYGLLTNVWILSYLLPTALFGDSIPGINSPLIHVIRDAGPIAGWLLCGAIYLARFRPSVSRLLFVALFCVASFIGNSPTAAFPEVVLDGASAVTLLTQLGFGIYAIRLIQTNSSDDLVENRRATRLVVTSSMAVAGFFVMVLGVLHKQADVPPWLEIGMIGFIAVMLFITIARVFHLDSTQSFMAAANVRSQVSLPLRLTASHFENSELIGRLDRLMNEDHMYLQPGLTVGELAERTGIAEHQLRNLINGELGFRNFSTFLNLFRIRSACEQLQDIQSARIPVRTIALDLGFRSIGPFNRAFKAEIGVTPSQYRRDRLKIESSEIIADNSLSQEESS